MKMFFDLPRNCTGVVVHLFLISDIIITFPIVLLVAPGVVKMSELLLARCSALFTKYSPEVLIATPSVNRGYS